MTNFIVSNTSDSPAKVSITALTIAPKTDGNTICPINNWATLEIKALTDNSAPWQPLPQARYKFDAKACSAQLEILPGESISITKELNYDEKNKSNELPPGGINRLSILTKNGEILLTELQIFKHFTKVDRSTYVYAIK